jgi:hypothetical protein
MNLSKLGFSSWIIFLNIILLMILFTILITNRRETFINYPQQVDPAGKPSSDPEAATANNNYASILMFLQKNPAKSVKFIKDVKQKFFNDSCTIKDDIDFNNIAKMPFGMPF